MTDAFIQTLEDRKFFAAHVSLTPSEVVNPHLTATTLPNKAELKAAQKAAKAQKPAKVADAPLVRSTDLVGEWEGHIKVKYFLFSKKYDFDMSIFHQTDNSISGRIEIDGHDFEGTFYGKINEKNGRFRYKLDDDGEEVTIKGQLGKKGLIIGGGSVKAEDWGWDWGWDIKGSFEVDRIA
ncbi:hypothetical protein [Humisphaera borealis]|uniref:Uncharacterized protein n=1 Tax=Humisphaera borealis TaxID=2807512 RepID=A0A7M2WV32_9BACT|nr:hypothetical protein [Humisphaera borealis]QOV89398.1 hypothetical protein IPV69_24890 [Humisphaera borealis]